MSWRLLTIQGLYFLVFLALPSDTMAQVRGTTEVIRPVTSEPGTISVRWNILAAKQWEAEHGDRLEAMGIQLEMTAGDLADPKSASAQYRFESMGQGWLELEIYVEHREPGEQLYLYDPARRKIVFQMLDQDSDHLLTPAFDPASTLMIWSGGDVSGLKSRFHIPMIYVDENANERSRNIGFGAAQPCHPNTACKNDSVLQLIAASTVRMRLVMEEGIGWCSGSFVNTTRQDKTPYVLTAYHCQYNYTPKYDLWRFDFDYASSSCVNPALEPVFYSMTGCERIAVGQASDFLLVRLNNPVPPQQNITFVGWNRDDAVLPDTSYLVHHPRADIRKISTCTNIPVIHPNQIGWSEGYTTPAHHHLRLKFTEGGHEAGSSGGPYFNQTGQLTGQLHGGTVGCELTNNTYIGRLSRSWSLGTIPGERLRDWLDPDQTGAVSITSISNTSADDFMDIEGIILDPHGQPVKNVVVRVTGGTDQTLTTGPDGTFLLEGMFRHSTYTITPRKLDLPTNGLSALDLVGIQKHLLAIQHFEHPWQLIAADASYNGAISVGDIVVLANLMLGRIQFLPTSPSWRFDPFELILDGVPSGEPARVELMAIKIGDVNGTADPQK